MTPEERTEKILNKLYTLDFDPATLGQYIAAEIRAAVEECLSQCMVIDKKTSEDCYAQGLEDAAKIVEQVHSVGLLTVDLGPLASRIRARIGDQS